MEKKMTALQKTIKDLRRMNTASTLYIADMLEKDYLPKEREQMIDFHIEVMKLGLINEGGKKWEESYRPKIEQTASDYFTQTYQPTE